ncbi:hypothetical protein NDU88_003477 [Pleurodeles waltl]|uniref:Uncharacterized protein n=1 Tax=Pleurodeles waltl TaxID=8319 RepID=A0AAV7KWM1_PLEWA|nr:hypothetical protein NDU88_003477 [Pleurodeles waltl]
MAIGVILVHYWKEGKVCHLIEGTHQKEEDEEVAAGEWNTAAALGGQANNPTTLLEKRGTIRSPLEEVHTYISVRYRSIAPLDSIKE